MSKEELQLFALRPCITWSLFDSYLNTQVKIFDLLDVKFKHTLKAIVCKYILILKIIIGEDKYKITMVILFKLLYKVKGLISYSPSQKKYNRKIF